VTAGKALVGCVLCGLVAAPAARAQDAAPRPHSFEVSAGVLGIGGTGFGKRAATLTANDPGAPDYTLFNAESSVGVGVGVEGRLSFNVTRTLAFEAEFSWVRQTSATRVTADIEGSPDVTASGRLDTYLIEGAALVHLRKLAFAGGRGVPFVRAGTGHLRQLDDQHLVTGTGAVFDAGGGVKYYFVTRRHGVVRAVGLRADGRFVVRSGGFDPSGTDRSRATWVAAGSVVIGH
jgi:hypothetical protein